MNPIERMEAKKDDFTPNELLIYQFMKENPERVGAASTSLLAAQCGVSQPALTRFVKNLGYSRYQEFRSDMIAWQSKLPKLPEQGFYGDLDALIRQMQSDWPESRVSEIYRWLSQFRRIYASGIAKSYQPAELLEILSRKRSGRVHAVRQDFLREICDYLDAQDVLILFTAGGSKDLLQYAKMTTAKIMVVTANSSPCCREDIDQLVLLPCLKDPESSPVSPILFDIFVELLSRQA